jgi:hypothetical protein
MKKTTASGSVEMTADEQAVVIATQTDATESKKKTYKLQLGKAANDYVYNELGNFGIVFATTGAPLLNRPKCLSTVKWVNAVWKEHNDRKQLLDTVFPPNLDFSNIGKPKRIKRRNKGYLGIT